MGSNRNNADAMAREASMHSPADDEAFRRWEAPKEGEQASVHANIQLCRCAS